MTSGQSTKGARVLVTGGCGYIGSHVVLALIDAGARPIVLDDLSNGDVRLLPAGVPFFQGNCGDPTVLARIAQDHGLDAVMHFAGKIIVPESVDDPVKYYSSNTVNSLTLMEFAKNHHLKFLFSSTAAVYGEAGGASSIAETEPTIPINPYGRSKLMTEWMLRDCSAAYGLRYGALRYFNVAGADPASRAGQVGKQVTHLIRVISQVALGIQPQLTIYGTDYPTPDGTCVRDYIHVSDLADAHVLAIGALLGGSDSFTLNCGYGRGATVLEVVAAFESVTNRPIAKVLGPRRAGDPPALVAQSDKIRSVLHWQPRHDSLKTIVETALNWERKRWAQTE
ncbi:MAG TPA: UDP-glucose 4-epimerase GalE [Alphaproteobacteria bacterium]|nr:UDP-glucose 4-epimerase GalE [Alphaproteobacteria bacterium]